MLTAAELDALVDKIADSVVTKMAGQPLLISKSQLAKRSSLSLATIDRYVANGTIPAVRIGRRVMFDPNQAFRSFEQQQ